MSEDQIENLEIARVTEDILLVHQKKVPFYFSCCDGLLILPKIGRNTRSIALDLNIEPQYVQAIWEKYGPVSDYVCTHGHMDHMAHVHKWEELGANICAPHLEAKCLLDLKNFYEAFNFNEIVDFSIVKKFGDANGYQPCKKPPKGFRPGDILIFEDLEVETLPFLGHSKGHVGFLLPNEKVIHLSCLGFDKPTPEKDGFGPWYGFRECSIEQYFKDIDYAESFYLRYAKFLTSSHAFIVTNPDRSPFEYMRNKIEANQKKVDQAIEKLGLSSESDADEIQIGKFLDLDIFFPKRKMKGFLLDIYSLWEFWIIKKHIIFSGKIKV